MPWALGIRAVPSLHPLEQGIFTHTPPFTLIHLSWHHEVPFLHRGAWYRERAARCITTAAALVRSTLSKRSPALTRPPSHTSTPAIRPSLVSHSDCKLSGVPIAYVCASPSPLKAAKQICSVLSVLYLFSSVLF